MNITTQARTELAGLLYSRRKQLKMTQGELAEKTGLHILTIQRIEKAKFWLKLDTLISLCDALKLKLKIE